MSPGSAGLVFAVSSMIFMGISSFLYKRSTDILGATNTTFYYYFFSIIIATVVWLLFRERQEFPASALVWPALIAVCLFFSVWFFNLSLRSIDVSIAATVRGLFFLVTITLAVVFTKEQPSGTSIAAMSLAAGAVILLGFDAVTK